MRSGIGLTTLISLLLVFSVPVLAEHEINGPAVAGTAEDFPGGPPARNCPAGTTAIRFGNGAGEGGLSQGSTFGGVTLTELNVDAGTASFAVADPNVAVFVFMKGGDGGQNAYDYSGFAAGGVAHDDDLVTPTNPSGQPAGISHIDFCARAAIAPTVLEGTAGGGGGPGASASSPPAAAAASTPAATVPNTATSEADRQPSVLLGLMLVGALSWLGYIRVARRRAASR